MAHFAELDENSIVIRVIVADTKEWCENNLGGTWIQTSYNTHRGVHRLGGIPLHKNYAGIGYTFDGIGFAEPKPFPSWILNTETYTWEAPIPLPTDSYLHPSYGGTGEGKSYKWDEENQQWTEVI